MMLAAIMFGRVSLASAKQDRLQERSKLQRQLNEYVERTYDPEALHAQALRVPFQPDDPALDRRLLATFMVASTGDAVSSAALIRLDDESVVSRRPAAHAPPTPTVLGTAWQAASRGKAARTPVFQYEGEAALAIAVPVGALKQWGVLVVTRKLRTTSAQQFAQDLGSLGQGAGGYGELDPNGRAVASWDPAQLGEEQVDPKIIAQLPYGVTRVSTSGVGRDQVTRMLYRNGNLTGLFEQPTDRLFADLKAGQKQRDRALTIVLLLALGAVLTMSIVQFRGARRDRARLQALLAGAHDLILVLGYDGLMTFVSPNLPSLLGHSVTAWTGTPLTGQMHPDDAERVNLLLAEPDAVRSVPDVRLKAPDGTFRWFDITASDLRSDRMLTGVLLTCRDTGQRKQLEDKLFEQSRRDPLTGLANRATLDRELATRLARPGTSQLALLFIDLDGFKQVNDQHGHEAGDRLLETVAARLRRVRAEALVARYGGDEFVLLVNDSDVGRVRELAGRAFAAISRSVDIGDGVDIQVGASIGIALAEPGVGRPDLMLAAADRAMYEAKRSGGGIALAPRLRPIEGSGPDDAGVRPQPATAAVGGESSPPARRSAPDRASPPRQSGRWPDRRAMLTVAATVLAIVAVAGMGFRGAAQAQHEAERHRIAERLEITGRVADYASVLAAPDRLLAPVNAAPWSLDGSPADILILQGVLKSDLGGDGTEAALYSPDGSLLAGQSASTTALAPGSARFELALTGHVGYEPLILVRGVGYAGYAIPIIRAGQVAAVLLVYQPLALSSSEYLLELVGSLGFGAGGVSSVLADGSVTHSWNPALIGSTLATPAALATVHGDAPRVIPGQAGHVVLAARMDLGPGSGDLVKYIVLDQPTPDFYAGIRDSGRERNLAALGGVLLCLLVIGLGGWRRNQQELRAHQRLNTLLGNAHDIVAITSPLGRIDFISSAVQSLLGRRAGSCAGMLDLVHPDDRTRTATFLGGGFGPTLRDVRLLQADGEPAWFDLQRTDLTADRDLRGLVLTCQEIGERKELRDRLAHLVDHDELTGLPNRTRILAELAERTGELYSPCSVLFIDLDRFKPVNDTYGHEAGDSLLRSIADRLAECVRDIPGALVGRLGGDEFTVLLPGRVRTGDSRSTPEAVAERILRAIAEPVPLWNAEARRVTVGATIGIARNSPLHSPGELLRRADQAMYEAKDACRGRYVVAG